MITIYGVPFSAHTRKVILTARLKNLTFNLEPVVPLAPPDGWERLSPVGKIPAFKEDDFILSDSSVICAYLDKKYPHTSIYPEGLQDFARALWFEEYVDSNLEQFILKQFLLETIFAPAFLKQETNWDVVNNALNTEIPQRFQQLERWVKADQYLVANQFSIADITLASILINFNYGGKCVDEVAYPNLAAYFKFVLQNPTIRATLSAENEAAKTVPGFDFTFLQSVI
jgi:glutathione S-transferase